MTLSETICLLKEKADGADDYMILDKLLLPQLEQWLKELEVFQELQEDDRFLTLPCQVGDTVFMLENNKNIVPFMVTGFYIMKEENVEAKTMRLSSKISDEEKIVDFSEIGSSVFLSEGDISGYIERVNKNGHWIINPDGYYLECSVCYHEPKDRNPHKVCPGCGAKMETPKELEGFLV